MIQVKIWFQNRRSKFKKMLKANNQGGPGGGNGSGSNAGGPGSSSGPGGSSPGLHTPTSASTAQTPPETPESQTPPNVGAVLPPGSGQSSGSMNPLPASSSSMSTVSPPAMSPPAISNSHPSVWDMGSAKAAAAMSSSPYLQQYTWYHHGHDPNMNPQLLT